MDKGPVPMLSYTCHCGHVTRRDSRPQLVGAAQAHALRAHASLLPRELVLRDAVSSEPSASRADPSPPAL